VLKQDLEREKLELQKLLIINVIKTQKMVEPIVHALWKATDRELVKKLQEPNPLVRWFATDILSRRQIHVEKEMIALLKDPYVEVRSSARQALVRLGRGTDFGPSPSDSRAQIDHAVDRWQRWLDMQDPASQRGSNRGRSLFDRYIGEKKSGVP
jgi:hypothetical protein